MSGCTSCSTTSSGGTGGCQNNGTCGTSDCNKMNSFDWLSHMGIPEVDNFDIIEIKFKGGRKEYYRNVDYLPLTTGDPVVVDVPSGHHIGYVSLQGELVRLQMQKRKVRDDDNILKIYRIATQKDLEKWQEAKNREIPTLYRSKQIIDELKLQMKMSDIEYQADNSKATFYYSAEDRIDFRELIKLLAGEFRIRVEMRQISLRQEAGRLGGIGVCGRELCCSTWLVDFKNVSTSAARYQNLSLNPGKLSGQCGRLKCCLNYELDTYMDAIKDIPQVDRPLLTDSGPAKLQKTDIFRKLMWFSYNNDNDWHSITCERVKEIIELNTKNIKVFNLKVNQITDLEDLAAKSTRELELLDKKFASRKKKSKIKPRGEREFQPNQVRSPLEKPRQDQPVNQSLAESNGPENQKPASEIRKNKNRNKNRNNQKSTQTSGEKSVTPPVNTADLAREPKQNLESRKNEPVSTKTDNKPIDQNPQAKSKFPPREKLGPELNNRNEKDS